MLKREELLSSQEYWEESIKDELFRQVDEYMSKKGITKAELAKELGVNRSYITQLLNGEFNHRISKLVEISLHIGKVPLIKFEDIDTILKEDRNETDNYLSQEIAVSDKENIPA